MITNAIRLLVLRWQLNRAYAERRRLRKGGWYRRRRAG